MSNIAHFSTNWTQWDIKAKQKKVHKVGRGLCGEEQFGQVWSGEMEDSYYKNTLHICMKFPKSK